MKIKNGDIVRNRLDNLVGKVVVGKGECSIESLENDDNRWVVRTLYPWEFEKDWRVIKPGPEHKK
jgi:hypothetical protein